MDFKDFLDLIVFPKSARNGGRDGRSRMIQFSPVLVEVCPEAAAKALLESAVADLLSELVPPRLISLSPRSVAVHDKLMFEALARYIATAAKAASNDRVILPVAIGTHLVSFLVTLPDRETIFLEILDG
jgi:hypothetical protein